MGGASRAFPYWIKVLGRVNRTVDLDHQLMDWERPTVGFIPSWRQKHRVGFGHGEQES